MPSSTATLGALIPLPSSRSPSCGTRAHVPMSMVHGQLLQGMPLCFAQLDDAFHRASFVLDSLIKRANFKTVDTEHHLKSKMR
ncbi:MAG: hypothetical protein CBARDCOR_4206 [uncultured Caballeronia sp.]|nr:MAG: hypothetical protein CBARDCOR_4206 [uncultured Caballeronia sp.]